MGSATARKARKQAAKNGKGSHGPVIEISSSTKLSALLDKANVPVLIDFWAPWCAPCKAMAPAFEAAAKDLGSSALLAKINTEASPALASAFNIRSIPTVLVFVDGEVVDVHTGMASQAHLTAMFQRAKDRQEGVGMVDKVKRWFAKDSAKPQQADAAT